MWMNDRLHKKHSIQQRFSVIAAGIFRLAILFILSGCASSEKPAAPLDLMSAIQNRGTLAIATDPSYPPQSELKKGVERSPGSHCAANEYSANQLEGFDIQVGLEVSRRLGVEACFVAPAWTQIIGGSWDGRWDVSIGSMAITRERSLTLYFTQPYISGAAVLFVHKDNRNFSAPADLSGMKIGVCAGCAYESYLKGSLEIPGEAIDLPVKNAVVFAYDTDTSALADLALGDGVRLDAVMTDPDTGQDAIFNGLPIRQLGGPLYYDYSAIAIDKRSNKDPQSLVNRITELIQQMHQDGTLLKLSEQTYRGDFTTRAGQYDLNTLKQFSSP
jgi:polar amino acid transport system substrate-binding protein